MRYIKGAYFLFNNEIVINILSAFRLQQPIKKQLYQLTIFSIVNGITFVVFFDALNFDFFNSFVYIFNYSIAWIVGVITLVAPAGAGVREVVFVSLSSMSNNANNLNELLAVAISIRIWQLLVDILGLSIFWGVVKNKNKN